MWSKIEQKYGLTGNWYLSAKYGDASDIDAVGLYNSSTNVTGWGGPTRPFKKLDNLYGNILAGDVVIIDSGYYSTIAMPPVGFNTLYLVGDGNVTIGGCPEIERTFIYNCRIINSSILNWLGFSQDCQIYYSKIYKRTDELLDLNNLYVECEFAEKDTYPAFYNNCTFVRCTGSLPFRGAGSNLNNFFVDCETLTLSLESIRPVGFIGDYSIIIGSIKTSNPINGKTTGVTIEDFKIDGQYFRKSYSEVDIFANTQGSGATLIQLQTLFNNFFYPYLDDLHYLDCTLKPTISDIILYGGLSNTYIGAFEVGYSFLISNLWNTYKDDLATVNVELDIISSNLVPIDNLSNGIFTTTEISLPEAVEGDVSMFFRTDIYNADGVATQTIDYTPDPVKDNTLSQRTKYTYRLKYASNDIDPLSDWLEFELDKVPQIDSSGNPNGVEIFNPDNANRIIIKRFILEIILINT